MDINYEIKISDEKSIESGDSIEVQINLIKKVLNKN